VKTGLKSIISTTKASCPSQSDGRGSEMDEVETQTETVEDSPAIPAPDTTPPGGDEEAAPAPSVPPHEREPMIDDDAPAAEDAEPENNDED